MKPQAEVPSKRNYLPPHLLKYGTLTEMTASGGSHVMNDAIKGGGNKT